MEQIENAIKLMRQTDSNVWIDLTTGEILNFYQRLGRKNVMVLRPSETDETLRNVWLRNNELMDWKYLSTTECEIKIYGSQIEKEFYIKAVEKDGFFEVHQVENFETPYQKV